MELLTTLQNDMKAAMKSGEKAKLQVIRMLISEVKNIDLQPSKPTPEQAVEGYAKKLRKSSEEFAKLGKTAEVEALAAELKVVEAYLPKKASAEETTALVEAFLAKNAFTEKQVGQAMGAFMKAHGQQVDPGVANPILRAKLAGK
ncbi:MAG TPA: GatB/YqeY domain-containing protein [Humisphaera sp.]